MPLIDNAPPRTHRGGGQTTGRLQISTQRHHLRQNRAASVQKPARQNGVDYSGARFESWWGPKLKELHQLRDWPKGRMAIRAVPAPRDPIA